MKSYLTITLFLLSSLFAFAQQSQLTKGSSFISGNMSFVYGDNQRHQPFIWHRTPNLWGIKSLRSSAMLNYGFFVADNFAIGAGLGGGIGRRNPSDAYPSKERSYSLSGRFFARHYIALSKDFALYSEAYAHYAVNQGKITRDDLGQEFLVRESSGSAIDIGFNAGLAIFVSKRVSFDFNVGLLNYFANQSKSESFSTLGETVYTSNFESSGTNMQLSLSNLSFNIGVSVFF
jgi:hypothetical protein